jgi:hypothetical protein
MFITMNPMYEFRNVLPSNLKASHGARLELCCCLSLARPVWLVPELCCCLTSC